MTSSTATSVGSPRARLTLASIAVAFAAADTYVVVLALPDMMAGVGLSADQLQRAAPIVSGFLLGYIAVLPLIGRIADVVGRTPVLVGALLLFAVGSLITATAYDLTLVVTGRFLQGIGGGGLVPATLALVADLWPPGKRGLPLGVVGAVQELGSVVGPLLGAAVLAVADWRYIFWLNLAVALVLAVLLRGRRRPPLSAAVGLLACVALGLTLTAPERLATGVTLGLPFVPFTGDSRLLTPIGVVTLVLLCLWLVLLFRKADLRSLLGRVDLIGALLLALALAGVVLAFATADPEREVLAPAGPWLLLAAAVFAVVFAAWQRRTPRAIVPAGLLRAKPAWGSLVISFLVGAALIAALVDVPVFARTTQGGGQLAAALVLLRFLVALPVGAVVGGWLTRRYGLGWITGAGLALAGAMFVVMAFWGRDALDSVPATLVLLGCGFGFGLALSPVNTAMLAATPQDSHGLVSALVVVARMVGMLVGVSALTAIGLRRYYALAEDIPSPNELCPTAPGSCRPFVDALREAAIAQVHTIFAGAAVCAFAAAVLAVVLLGRRRAVHD
ncbi:major facilitator superfamily MFS_1 [Kribbella flavida DSM 17836]|uniref:Major facilitator superfamily MFS_1 n=1 Tax=Kribbella flavida (strain DSM 17836 / JCM 10339 / NBRC 14399) TaxID=479435 RepID=D2PLS9_KRIFD|nr:MFS transporter [Kribbella flavida]ADB32509.1 major facilitator superfamily MFS_1 [Kribbella flavida DSM 17836]